jgi:dTDP-4-dehydrorhamnose 3,5-epimerase
MPKGATIAGVKDRGAGEHGDRAEPVPIHGVTVTELSSVLTRSGLLLEAFRTDWPSVGIAPRQVNWVQMTPSGVTDWHRHEHQTDHLVAVDGIIKLALWDDRPDSPTRGATQTVRMGIARPVLVVIPPGVFHALRNESGAPAGYLNVIDEIYLPADPDNWRLPADSSEPPDIL